MGILEELRDNIPTRFANMSPRHFEELTCELFKDAGHQVEITKATADFGADMILTKDNSRTAVQVKKYQAGNLVQVKEIHQIIGAKEYYKCDNALFVTTSDFTKPARKFAEKTNVVLWSWDILYDKMQEIYLSKPVSTIQRQGERPESVEYKRFALQIEDIRENVSTIRKKEKGVERKSTVVRIKMTNTTNEKTYVTAEKPIALTRQDERVEAEEFFVGGFTQGYVSPGESVCLVFCWDSYQIPKGKLIEFIMVRYREDEYAEIKEQFVYRGSSTKIVDEGRRQSRCFIATAVYGTSLAPEIDILRNIRDKLLLTNKLGQEFVNLYCQFSPPLADFISRHLMLRKILRETIIKPTTKVMKFLNI